MCWRMLNCVRVCPGIETRRIVDASNGFAVINQCLCLGIKEYSDWPTIPQLYLDKEFVGGCDILMSMHQNGELAKLLEERNVLVATD